MPAAVSLPEVLKRVTSLRSARVSLPQSSRGWARGRRTWSHCVVTRKCFHVGWHRCVQHKVQAAGRSEKRVKASRDCREWVRAVKGIEGSSDADSLSCSGDRINRGVRCVGVVGESRAPSLVYHTDEEEWSGDDLCVEEDN